MAQMVDLDMKIQVTEVIRLEKWETAFPPSTLEVHGRDSQFQLAVSTHVQFWMTHR